MTKLKTRFATVRVLRKDTPILGATADEWDRALTGNMQQTLMEVKRLAESGVKRDVSQATTFDLGTFVGKQLRSRNLPRNKQMAAQLS